MLLVYLYHCLTIVFLLSQLKSNPNPESPLPALATEPSTPLLARLANKVGKDAPFVLMVNFALPAGSKNTVTNLSGAIKAVTDATVAEAGCGLYQFYVDADAPTERLVLLERWENVASLSAHFQAPHLPAWRDAITAAGGKPGFTAAAYI